MSRKRENGTIDPVPDSTTKANYNVNDEVLMQRKDGNFYLGVLVKIDWSKEQAFVKFGDDTESWSGFSRLTKLSSGVECDKCKESAVEPTNDILVCGKCSQGFHQLCHSPPAELKNGTIWECGRCQDTGKARLRKTSISPVTNAVPEPPPIEIPANVATECQRKKLPYNINDLHWDMQRRVNTENKYCYCGGTGKWFLQMLQCGRCRQWFHARCILSMRMPLLFGDRFFVFICSICNAGKEFLRRLEVKWLDLVHLAIFNLTLTKAVKYQDVDDDIVSFLNEHWDELLLPPKMKDTSLPDRRDHVLSVLNANRNRFRYSREMKKRTTMWGLKHRVPPPTPVFSLPPNKPLSDQVLLDAWNNNARLQFLPSPPNSELPSKKYDLYPDWEKNGSNLPGLELLHVGSRPLILPKGVPATGHNVCIKSSSPCYPESRAQIERRIKAQTLENEQIFRSRKSRKHDEKSPRESQDLPPTPPSSESNLEAPPNLQDTSGDESSSRGTLDSFIPPPMDFEGRNNPFMPSLPLTLTPVVRPTKRRLSEKDIRITSNGEIKRRRVRRGGKMAGRASQIPENLRRMKRPRSGPSTPTASPVKTCPTPYNAEDLKNTVNSYFGAMNRIASGEKFTVRARRILPTGLEVMATYCTDDLNARDYSLSVMKGVQRSCCLAEKRHVKAERLEKTLQILPQGLVILRTRRMETHFINMEKMETVGVMGPGPIPID